MSERKWKRIGVIGVDAGLCWIGDPCYCVTPDATEHPAPTWDKFCEMMEGVKQKQFNYKRGHAGLGVCTDTYTGDGRYPVYADIDDHGRTKAVKVVFDVQQ